MEYSEAIEYLRENDIKKEDGKFIVDKKKSNMFGLLNYCKMRSRPEIFRARAEKIVKKFLIIKNLKILLVI